MDKSEFNSLDITKQIEEFNKLISAYGSASAASRILEYNNESTLRKRFKNRGYAMNKEKTKYIKVNKSETIVKNNSDTLVIEQQMSAFAKEIQDLKKFKIEITEMLEWYKKEKDRDNIIDIEIPEIKILIEDKEEKAITRGLKTYPSVLNKFDEFCVDHKEFRKQDLLAMALTEYMNRYK